MPFISTADVILLLFLFALQEWKRQAAAEPIRRPVTATTTTTHTDTVLVQPAMRGSAVVVGVVGVMELWAETVLFVSGGVVVVELGKLFAFVKM